LSFLILTPWPFRKTHPATELQQARKPLHLKKDSLQLPWKLSEKKPAVLIPVAIFSASYIYIHIMVETATTTTTNSHWQRLQAAGMPN